MEADTKEGLAGRTGSATDDPPCCDACGLEYALREGDEVSRFCDPCCQSAFMRLESVAKQAVELILKSEQTGWCKHATAAKELLEAALGQSPNAEVSDGGPLTHDSKQARTRRSLH